MLLSRNLNKLMSKY